jgi:hypothetical protein
MFYINICGNRKVNVIDVATPENHKIFYGKYKHPTVALIYAY